MVKKHVIYCSFVKVGSAKGVKHMSFYATPGSPKVVRKAVIYNVFVKKKARLGQRGRWIGPAEKAIYRVIDRISINIYLYICSCGDVLAHLPSPVVTIFPRCLPLMAGDIATMAEETVIGFGASVGEMSI